MKTIFFSYNVGKNLNKNTIICFFFISFTSHPYVLDPSEMERISHELILFFNLYSLPKGHTSETFHIMNSSPRNEARPLLNNHQRLGQFTEMPHCEKTNQLYILQATWDTQGNGKIDNINWSGNNIFFMICMIISKILILKYDQHNSGIIICYALFSAKKPSTIQQLIANHSRLKCFATKEIKIRAFFTSIFADSGGWERQESKLIYKYKVFVSNILVLFQGIILLECQGPMTLLLL